MLGLGAGKRLPVTLTINGDSWPRSVEVPDDLGAALADAGSQ